MAHVKTEPELELELIQGSLLAVVAADILHSCIYDKIKFHTVRQLKDKDEPNISNHTKERIKELNANKNEVTELILKARNENYQLEIKDNICICLQKLP